MPTSFPMANPWADNTLENAVALYNFITVPINDLAALEAANGQGWLGEASGMTTVTLATGSAAQNYATCTTGFTWTQTTTRRVRIVTMSYFTLGTGGTTGRYWNVVAYNVGSSIVIGSAVVGGGANHAQVVVTGVGASYLTSGLSEATFLLAAGTYTAYPAGNRASGGTATDTATGQYCAVYDVGAV